MIAIEQVGEGAQALDKTADRDAEIVDRLSILGVALSVAQAPVERFEPRAEVGFHKFQQFALHRFILTTSESP